MSKRWIALLALGLLQMVADLSGISVLRAAAAATAASPAPKVFTRVGQREPFSAQFALLVVHRDGALERIALTPERYSRLAGPYNRRNAFGAAIAAAPELSSATLTQSLFAHVASYGLCGEAPALRELGASTTPIASVLLERRNATGALDSVRVACP
jgi:hypothetical protein